MRAGLFWLNDGHWASIAPRLPTNMTGPKRADDRRIISGIIHMLQCGARGSDCPPEYGPYTTSTIASIVETLRYPPATRTLRVTRERQAP